MNIQITGIFLLPIVSILTIVLLYPLRTIPKKYIGLFFTISSFVLFSTVSIIFTSEPTKIVSGFTFTFISDGKMMLYEFPPR